MATLAADGMPTTRGLDFDLADPNLQFVCSTVPASVFTVRDCAWLPALVDWTPVAGDALAADPAGGC